MKLYKLVFKNKEKDVIFLGTYLYDELEIKDLNNTKELYINIVKREHLKLYPDDKLLYSHLLQEELEKIEIIGKTELYIEGL